MSNSFDHDAFGASSTGLDPKLAAALAYIPIIGLIFFFIEKKSTYVKYHSAHALLLHIVVFAVEFVFGFIPIIGALVNAIVGILGFVLAVVGAINAWNGKRVAYPYLGQWAEQWSRNL